MHVCVCVCVRACVCVQHVCECVRLKTWSVYMCVCVCLHMCCMCAVSEYVHIRVYISLCSTRNFNLCRSFKAFTPTLHPGSPPTVKKEIYRTWYEDY